MRRLLLLMLLCLPAGGLEILPVEQIKPGLKGYGLSVFSGTEPERFGFEVIDLVRNIYPGQDMALCRIEHPLLEKAGVVSGMSGSPMYVQAEDGRERLLGALAYGWRFCKEPIAGVTPAEQMLKAPPVQPAPAAARAGQPGELLPLAAPLMVSGASARTLDALRRLLPAHGFMPVEGGGQAGEAAKLGRPLKAGDAVGVRLLAGDMDWTAIGTATWVDGETVYAFGHPFGLSGPVQFPLTAARVHMVVPSMLSSFKLSSALETVGMLEMDYMSGICGRLGAGPAMMRLEVVARSGAADAQTFRYEVARMRAWQPLIAALAVLDSLEKALPYGEDCAVEYGITVTLAGGPAHTLRDKVMARTSSAAVMSLYRAIGSVLYDAQQPAEIEGVRVETLLTPGNFSAAIVRARGPVRADAGERFNITVDIRPFGKPPDELLNIPLEVQAPLVSSRRTIEIAVAPADVLRPPQPAPRSAAEFLQSAALYESPEVLRAVVRDDAFYGAVGEARTLRLLPASAAAALREMDGFFTEGRAYEAKTGYILEGRASISVPVEPK